MNSFPTKLGESRERMLARELVNMEKTCHGCGQPYHSCLDVLHRNICLHKVMDYIMKVDDPSKVQMRRVFTEVFWTMVKKDMLSETFFYELNEDLELPRCVESGGLKDALELLETDLVYNFLCERRVHNVQHHINRRCRVPNDGERVIDESGKV